MSQTYGVGGYGAPDAHAMPLLLRAWDVIVAPISAGLSCSTTY
jgi:hypothetical protein